MADKNFEQSYAQFSDDLLSVENSVTNAYTRFKDLYNGVSVREQFTRDDYDYFRDTERVPSKKLDMIVSARKAYQKIGLIKNIIDLMGDFTCQGIDIVHEQPQVERFYKAWFNRVNGPERSERFANLLFRECNVIVKRDTAKLSISDVRTLKQSIASPDLIMQKDEYIAKREIPFGYTFISPTLVEPVGTEIVQYVDDIAYSIKIPAKIIRMIKTPKNDIEKALVAKLPQYIKDAANQNGRALLDMSKTKAYFYKKDDWELWATPLIYPIMDDLILLEKLKLADMTALDGAISYIRVWKIGSLDHKIVPGKAQIEKLRNVLLQNAGGGSMDLIWGPDIELQESSTDISKFLGIQKYEPVMMNIYQGLGIPPTLTAGKEGGMTNNSISLKTLIERLNYGRMILSNFWEEEIKIVQKAMGFAKPAQIKYDHMILTDENSFLSLLLQLADRNIISDEVLRDRVGETNIEKVRVNREFKERESGKLPPKTTPLNNIEDDLKKIALQRGFAPSEVGLELEPKKSGEVGMQDQLASNPSKNKGVPGQGRPKNSKDSSKRTRTPKPIGASQDVYQKMVWAQSAYAKISETILPSVLKVFKCKNVRMMTNEQFNQFELMKFAVLANMEPHSNFGPESILDILQKSPAIPKEMQIVYSELVGGLKEPTTDMLRSAQILTYATLK